MVNHCHVHLHHHLPYHYHYQYHLKFGPPQLIPLPPQNRSTLPLDGDRMLAFI